MNELDRDELTAHLSDETDKLNARRIIDVAERVLRTNSPRTTLFMDPRSCAIGEGLVKGIGGVRGLLSGGYHGAERQRMVIAPDYMDLDSIDVPLAAVQINLRGEPDAQLPHRDYLGSILGLGIDRDHVGDILTSDEGCQVIVTPEIAPVVLELKKAGRIPVEARAIELEQLWVKPSRVKQIRTTVASLRLDSIAASGYGTSRTKMARDVKAHKVRLNWRVVENPAHEVKVGDVISIRGRGRVEVSSITGQTKKGRVGVLLTRYI